MQHHMARLVILCFNVVGLAWAASSGSDGRLEVDESFSQPQRLDADSSEQPTSLLYIMQTLQRRKPVATVASEVQVQRRDLSGQTAHERQLLSDMGHLESQLESWKQAEQNLEQQVADQAQTVAALRREEAKAVHDEQVAAVVWWDCKMLMCVVLASGLAFCIYTSLYPGSQMSKSNLSTAEQSPEPVKRVRPQVEFVEKDADQEAEHMLQVVLPIAEADQVDLEAPKVKTEEKSMPHACSSAPDKTGLIMDHNKSESINCVYFSLDDEPTVQASPEDWWAESASGY